MTYTYPDYYEDGREKIREYVEAVKNDDDAYYDEKAADAIGYDAWSLR